MNCRGCNATISEPFLDLGPAPLANAFIDDVEAVEKFYPLRAYVCKKCWLVQLPAIAQPNEIFNEDYAYFSSVNAGFVEHARRFASHAIDRLGLTRGSLVVEIGSNDGYLLQHFKNRGIECFGVEPSANVAAEAVRRGVPTAVAFFGAAFGATCTEKADLIIANNVLAHVPDIHDFVEGVAVMLKPGGYASIEFPWVLNLIKSTQFDTIYHEHYSYLSIISLAPILAEHGLIIVDVEALNTHGGSLRVWVTQRFNAINVRTVVDYMAGGECAADLNRADTYESLAFSIARIRHDVLEFLEAHDAAGYGAPAKASTFLNYCGIKRNLLPFTVDGTPVKQGKYTPGTRIPIYPEDHLRTNAPSDLLVLAWNWKDEIAKRARESFGFTGGIYVAIPKLEAVI